MRHSSRRGHRGCGGSGYHVTNDKLEHRPAPARRSRVDPKFKLISSNVHELFEQRLADFIGSLDRDAIIVDTKFATTSHGTSVEYSALIHYQETTGWNE
jgi:hypothetical protein